MKIIQMLPALESGGVERGTIELNRFLAANGHESIVISAGGRQASRIEADGGRHITWPVGRKRLRTCLLVPKVRRLLEAEKPDILHLRSRLPAWVGFLAWRGLPPEQRPRLVTTVHGFYTPGRYSSVMARGQRVIAVSESIRQYILKNYSATDPAHIRVIHRGIDPADYPPGYRPSEDWLRTWRGQHPDFSDKRLLTLPARITRWKGQEHFLNLVRALLDRGGQIHGLIVGEAHPRRSGFLDELQERAGQMGLRDNVTFLGHRSDLREVLAVSDIVFSLSLDPEAFGRTTVEALSMGRPVIGYHHGGVGEQLAAMLPEGAVPVGDWRRASELARSWMAGPPVPRENKFFLLQKTLGATEGVYRELV